MTILWSRREEATLKERASYYEDKGYAVRIEPDNDFLPEFLVGLKPDLVAKNGHDNIVVEARTLETLRHDPYIQKLAEVIKEHPGWRFELAMVASKPTPLPDSDAQSVLDEAEKLQKAGFSDAAYLRLWSALEIALRRIVKAEDIELKEDFTEYLLKALISMDLIEEDVFNVLWDSLKIRNDIAHGYQPPEDKGVSLDKLVEIAKSLI